MSKPRNIGAGNAAAVEDPESQALELDKELQAIEIGSDSVSDFSSSWADFHSSIRSTRRESLKLLSAQSKRASLSTGTSSHVRPIDEGQEEEEEENRTDSDDIPSSGGSSQSICPVDTPDSSLTLAEKRDIWAWNARLSRDVVFSRYYFPQQVKLLCMTPP